ncbi:MAG: ORF6N domain-containing protein [Elusimicrobiota bacterium]
MNDLIPQEHIENKIFIIRGKRVMLDRDLAVIYGVETRVLNQAVRRNIERFPEDFMFFLTRDEIMNLSQLVISSKIKHAPNVFAFTQEGVAMLSGVLHSKRAVQSNIYIMRAFVRFRQYMLTYDELAKTIRELELKVKKRFSKQDKTIQSIMEAINSLLDFPKKNKTHIGFKR